MAVKCEDCGFVDDTCVILPSPSPNVHGTVSLYGNLYCRKCGSKRIVNVKIAEQDASSEITSSMV